MKTTLRKAAVLTATLALTFAMSVPAFAAGSSNPANPTNTNSIVIEKNLKVTNPTLASVDGPGASFDYTVAPIEPAADNGGLTITDAENHTGTVHQGPAEGLTLETSNIAYPIGTAVDASATGADNVKSITANADVTKFSAPGIYRYVLREEATLGDCEAQNTDGTRYIDVYVKNGASGLEVSGIVMHDGTTEDGKPAQKKTLDDASFETVNVTLTKQVAGNMADRAHQFPFAGTVNDHGRYFYAKKAEQPAAESANLIEGAAAGSAVSTTLAHQETYYIAGLSKSATVAYTETNDTQDTYQTIYTGGESSAVAPAGTKAMAATDVDDASAITFTNTLEEVSPTGVLMRFGPYIGMIAIAVALVTMRKKVTANK